MFKSSGQIDKQEERNLTMRPVVGRGDIIKIKEGIFLIITMTGC